MGAHIGLSRGYDVVIEAAGTESALSGACDVVRPGGTVLVLGVHWGTMSIPGTVAVSKELRVLSSMS